MCLIIMVYTSATHYTAHTNRAHMCKTLDIAQSPSQSLVRMHAQMYPRT